MAVLSENKIKEKVGDSWALIADPVYSKKNGKLLRGNLIFFDKDKRAVHKFTLKDNHKHITVRFFGEIPVDNVFILNAR